MTGMSRSRTPRCSGRGQGFPHSPEPFSCPDWNAPHGAAEVMSLRIGDQRYWLSQESHLHGDTYVVEGYELFRDDGIGAQLVGEWTKRPSVEAVVSYLRAGKGGARGKLVVESDVEAVA